MHLLRRFSNSCGVCGSSNVAFTSHPCKQQSLAGVPGSPPQRQDLSPGTRRKTPLDRIGSALHQLENRYSGYKDKSNVYQRSVLKAYDPHCMRNNGSQRAAFASKPEPHVKEGHSGWIKRKI